MHITGKLMVLAVALASFVANAADAADAATYATYTLKKEAVSNKEFDWSVASNYVENVKPSPGDHVIIPKDVNAKLTHGQECWGFVSSLGRIRPTTATSYFTVSVPEGVTATLACEITNTGENSSTSMNKGGLVKIGPGILDLTFEKYDNRFAFSCLPYTAPEIENATHHEELPPARRTVLCIYGAVRGVGGIDSWGSDVEAAYHINAAEDISYSFIIG